MSALSKVEATHHVCLWKYGSMTEELIFNCYLILINLNSYLGLVATKLGSIEIDDQKEEIINHTTYS